MTPSRRRPVAARSGPAPAAPRPPPPRRGRRRRRGAPSPRRRRGNGHLPAVRPRQHDRPTCSAAPAASGSGRRPRPRPRPQPPPAPREPAAGHRPHRAPRRRHRGRHLPAARRQRHRRPRDGRHLRRRQLPLAAPRHLPHGRRSAAPSSRTRPRSTASTRSSARDVPVELQPERGLPHRPGDHPVRAARRCSRRRPTASSASARPSKGYVGRIALVIGRDETGNAFPIPEGGVHLGRERGDILFPEDGYVSGLHCRLDVGRAAPLSDRPRQLERHVRPHRRRAGRPHRATCCSWASSSSASRSSERLATGRADEPAAHHPRRRRGPRAGRAAT